MRSTSTLRSVLVLSQMVRVLDIISDCMRLRQSQGLGCEAGHARAGC